MFGAKLSSLFQGRSVSIVLSMLLAVIIGALVILVSGANPFTVYAEIVLGSFQGAGLGLTLERAVPLVGMSLAAAIPLRAGVVNLGGDGQILIGGMVAILIALYAPFPGEIRLVLALVCAVFAAGLYAMLAALFETLLGIPFLISSLLLSYIARGVTSYLARFPLRDPSTGNPETYRVEVSARMPEDLFGLPISLSMIIILLLAIVLVVNDARGTHGFASRMRFINPTFVAYSGTNVKRQMLQLAFISGAIGGLVGAMVLLSEGYRFTDGILLAPAYTWSGLMAAILAMGAPLGAAITGLFLAALQTGGFHMERTTGLPSVLTYVLQALIILSLSMRIFGRGKKDG